MLKLAMVVAAAIPLAAQGWSPEWETVSATNYYFQPTPYHFMELVWATKERVAAAEESIGGFYINKLPAIYGSDYEMFCTTNDGYLVVTTNYSDMLEQWVTVTNAAYKDEFWKPTLLQVSHLTSLIIGLRSIFTGSRNDASLTNTYSAHWPWPEPWSNDVPQWVYHDASNIVWNEYGKNYIGIPPMRRPWAPNPMLEFSGDHRVYSNRPIDIINVPIWEYDNTGTAKVQERHVLKTFLCHPSDPIGTYALSRDELPPKSDYGVVACSSLVFRFETTLTNQWWNGEELSFRVRVASTNVDPVFLPFLLGNALTPMQINHNFLYFMETNDLTFTGTLPMEIPCDDFVPLDVWIEGDDPVFTNAMPPVVAEIRNFRTVAGSYNGEQYREGLASWNLSWPQMKFLHSCLTNMGTKTAMDCRLANHILAQADNATNLCADYDMDCDDLSRMSIAQEDFDVLLNSSNMLYRYNYEAEEWQESGLDVFIYASGYHGYDDPRWIATVKYASSIGLDGCQLQSSYGSVYTFSTYVIPLSEYYVRRQWPLSYDGTPRISSADIYATVAAVTNPVAIDSDLWNGETYWWYPENPMRLVGSWSFGQDDLIKNGIFLSGNWEPWINPQLVVGEFGITNTISVNGFDYLSVCQRQAVFAWGDTCSVSTNIDGSPFSVSKSGRGTVNAISMALAEWQFATNFDMYWAQYDAATNAP